jgi:hypothetical protein
MRWCFGAGCLLRRGTGGSTGPGCCGTGVNSATDGRSGVRVTALGWPSAAAVVNNCCSGASTGSCSGCFCSTSSWTGRTPGHCGTAQSAKGFGSACTAGTTAAGSGNSKSSKGCLMGSSSSLTSSNFGIAEASGSIQWSFHLCSFSHCYRQH